MMDGVKHTHAVDPATLKATGKAAKVVGGGLAVGGGAIGTGHVIRGRSDAKKDKAARIASVVAPRQSGKSLLCFRKIILSALQRRELRSRVRKSP